MLRIDCPYCGERDHVEFIYGGDADCKFPPLDDSDPLRWAESVFERRNPKGIHSEYWWHLHGCRQWLRVVRDTVTHEVQRVVFASESERVGHADTTARADVAN